MRSSLPFSLIIMVGALGYLGYVVNEQKIPCVTPLSYSLAAYDERFNLPSSEVSADLRQAARVWNDALGMNAFVEATSTPDLPVSFVYDKTQATVDSIEQLSGDIDTLKAELTSVANQYSSLKDRYESLNARGQATQEMYDELQTLFSKYESIRKKINADVAQGQTLPAGSVEEGLYTSDSNGTRITVYAFQSDSELLRTLIHEFGHALGLGHVQSKTSIMYPSNNASQSLALSDDDLAEMARACAANKQQFGAVLYTYEHDILHALKLD